MLKWKAVVFDLDDTLYPERDYVMSGFRSVAQWVEAQLGIAAAQCKTELASLFNAGVRGKIFNYWLVAHGLSEDEYVPQLVQVYLEHEPVLSPFDGIAELLQALRWHVKLGLVSDGYLAVQQRKLAALRLEPYFSAIVFSDQWGREFWKPHVRPFQAVLNHLQVDGSSATYVADNPRKDFFGARMVGMGTIRLRLPIGEYAALEPMTAQEEPNVTLTSIAALSQNLLETS